MRNDLRNRAIALAGIVQAASLAQAIARKGAVSEPEMKVMIDSLFVEQAGDAEALYGSTERLSSGFRVARALLGGEALEQAKELMTYVVQVMALERKLAKRPDMLARLARGMQHARIQAQHFSTMHESVLANMADMYGQTVSQLMPRIILRGRPEYLGQRHNTDRIRVLLLAAIRAAHYWRRHGGRWWHVLLNRRRLAAAIANIAMEIRS